MKWLTIVIEFGCLVLATSLPQIAFASWQDNGNPISVPAEYRVEPRVVADGAGGAIVAWQDKRVGEFDVYVQRVDGYGNLLWTSSGVPVCTATGKQISIWLVSDNSGGAIITWQDKRRGEYDIYAQRVDASGNTLWQLDGVAVCAASGEQSYPLIVSDGQGGAVIAWCDFRTGDQGIYAQRLNAFGSELWTPDGILVCNEIGPQVMQDMLSDGSGRSIVAWVDGRSDDTDVYAQCLDGSGNLLWTSGGLPICTAPGIQGSPSMNSDDKGGAIITWVDWRNSLTSIDIYAQRVDASGKVMWSANGVPVCTAPAPQREPECAPDGAGGAIICWPDHRRWTDPVQNQIDIYAQRVDALGNAMWPPDGLPICTAPDYRFDQWIISDGLNGGIVVWHDNRSGDFDVYAQRIDGSGNILWKTDGVGICTAAYAQAYPYVASDGAGGVIAAWNDGRGMTFADVYVQRVERNGEWGYPAAEIRAVLDIPGDEGGFVSVAWDASRLDPWPDEFITKYTLWRAIYPQRVAGMLEAGFPPRTGLSGFFLDSLESKSPVLRIDQVDGRSFYWELVSSVDAYHMRSYSKTAPTLFDSTSVCGEYHYFQVIAHTANPDVYWFSQPDSGCSVDNLCPESPKGLAGSYSVLSRELAVTWKPNSEPDFSHYAVYKGDREGFVPNQSNRIGAPVEPFLVDGAFHPSVDSYYKVSAFDIHENGSPYSLLRPEDIGGISRPPALPAVTLLEQNVPNPFNAATLIRFAIAERGWVTLRIYDASGRRVRTLVEGTRETGRYEETWDACNDARIALASGVYSYKLEAPGHVETKKMVLAR